MPSMQLEDLIEQNLVERGAEYVWSGLRYKDKKLHNRCSNIYII